jgi:hypothetical protein
MYCTRGRWRCDGRAAAGIERRDLYGSFDLEHLESRRTPEALDQRDHRRLQFPRHAAQRHCPRFPAIGERRKVTSLGGRVFHEEIARMKDLGTRIYWIGAGT